MKAIILILTYFITSMYIGINQYMNEGELSTTFMVVTGIIFVLSIVLNLLLQNAFPGSLGETLAVMGGGIALLIIIQTVIFWIFSPLFINFHSLPTWKITLAIIGIFLVGRMAFNYLTKGTRTSM